MRIRLERPDDLAAIRAVNLSAFDASTEADLVDALRSQVQPLVPLVAEEGDDLVGHILFTPVTLDMHPESRIMGLAPMAVLPARQRLGIGSALVREGLDRCQRLGFGAVVVLGHADYYPRFGFAPASRYGLRCEYDGADDVFMALELNPGCLQGKQGTLRYHAAFANA